jgi:uncharacterized membrane protein
MPQRLRRQLDQLLTGTWFIPSVIASGAFVLSFVALELDAAAGRADSGWLKFVYTSEPVEARSLMSAMLTAMMTMASLVFSITMLVLTLASRQFGPRLLREFMSSAMTQAILGVYVMTILYCLLILASTSEVRGGGAMAHPSVTIGIALTFIDTVLLIFFLHSLGRSLMSESIISRIGRELDTTLGRLEPLRPSEDSDERRGLFPSDFQQQAAHFGTAQSGYVQAVEWSLAVRAAEAAGVLIVFDFRPGDYIVQGGRDIGVHPAGKCSAELRSQIAASLVLGTHRTPLQDPMFPIRHLVEVALRALSPGVNDPYTATAVLDRLADSLSRLMGLSLPSGVLRGASGQVRVMYQEATHSTVMDAAFDQIRQNGGDKPLVMIHLLHALTRIASHARMDEQVALLEQTLDRIEGEIGLSLKHPYDLASVKARLQRARKSIAGQHERLAARGHHTATLDSVGPGADGDGYRA